MAIPQKTSAAHDLLAAYPKPQGAGWIKAARTAADQRFAEMGAPIKRDEYWKFTDPTALTAPTTKAAVFDNDEAPMFHDIERLKLYFNDGVFDPEASDALELDGITIEPLSEAAQKDIHWAKELYGVLEAQGQNPVPRPLAALNTARAQNGFVIHITKSPSKPIWMKYAHLSETSDALVHHVIKVDAGVETTILESGAGAARFNSVMEFDLADNATLHHIRTQGRDHERKTVTHLFGRLAKESIFRSFTMTVNGVLTRNEAVLDFTGDDAKATVAGASAGDGKNFHHDDTVFVTHDAVNCESRQVFKKVLRNGATGVFQGKILVQPDAQKTDGYQISQGLLLDEDSQFLAKPELEIYADDVACSHGSTCGAIDETALYYLRARGILLVEAQNMMMLAFLNEAIDEIEDEDLAEEMRTRLQAWSNRHS
ncbi:MAG: SufD family Fe-S cluster assembly protein [Pseudomonadota bacterium]